MRKGDYCISHIENMRDNECISEKRYRELVRWGDFREKFSEISELSEGACSVLMHDVDSEIIVDAIEAITENISRGNIPTAKQVKQIVENKRAGVKPGGRKQSGVAREVKQKPNHVQHVVFPPKGDDADIADVEDSDLLDEEKDYYTGDTPGTPDMHEMLETPKADIVVPQDVMDTEDQMNEERAAREARGLQRKKEEEKNQREMVALEEKNENTRMRDELAADLTDVLKKAIGKGIPREYVSDALHLALDNVFEAEQPSGG